MPSTPSSSPRQPSLNRQILALAVPAFGALIAEPLLVLADSAIVGHLGSAPLAGLTLGSTVVQTLVGFMVFLAYSTTPAVARAVGAGDTPSAFAAARNSLWVAAGLGLFFAVLLALTADPLLRALGAGGDVLTHATAYLLPSLAGLPGMLLVLAATGALRGLQDAKTPLYVATAGAALNVPLSWALVYPAGWGVAGSAVATAVVQWGMALALTYAVVARTRTPGWLPDRAGLAAVFRVGAWLMVRAACLRIALLATVFVVTSQGEKNLAAYQLTMAFFNLLAFALDALAIAAQTLLGKEMGAQDLSTRQGQGAVVQLKNRLVRWSLAFGLVTALVCPAVGFGLAWVFTSDPEVQRLFALSLLVLAVGQPLAAYVFILDGVLIGAQDVRYLGLAGLFTLVAYLPVLAGLYFWFGAGADAPAPLAGGTSWGWGGLLDGPTLAYLLLWCSYALWYMGARALTLGLRARSGAWVA
ncbi:MATE family efflux transporter [Rothia nasimurium]|uniref:MATE family efflux transporter n=1 Tax=Rothia nasimurium TaxID=85336 RepID=A0A4Y9F158_9MICC|nr:MATE family efflux transporter [Rothia nasimurium]MBF0808989.1 MATE family efflux transporter [Rothia nasimurium]TFU20950.1 MATE family efflux transporter [Rothia nasimurium]